MSPMRGAVLAALTSATLLANAAAAGALADQPGGVAAPVSPQAGGSQFGVPASVARPELSYLTLPSTATAGRPPRIVLELVEPHTASVFLRVLMIDLHSRRTVLTAQMGWVPTSHRFAVVWPHGAQIGAGTYRVTVSSHDRHNGNIIRNARISGEATITVTAPPVEAVARARSRRAHARADASPTAPCSPCAGPTTSATPKTASARPAPATSTRARTC